MKNISFYTIKIIICCIFFVANCMQQPPPTIMTPESALKKILFALFPIGLPSKEYWRCCADVFRIKRLVDIGYDINMPFAQWSSALEYAITIKDKNLVELLLLLKADSNKKNFMSNTPLIVNIIANNTSTLDPYMSDVTIQYERATIDITRLLLRYGADPHEKNRLQQTAYDILKQRLDVAYNPSLKESFDLIKKAQKNPPNSILSKPRTPKNNYRIRPRPRIMTHRLLYSAPFLQNSSPTSHESYRLDNTDGSPASLTYYHMQQENSHNVKSSNKRQRLAMLKALNTVEHKTEGHSGSTPQKPPKNNDSTKMYKQMLPNVANSTQDNRLPPQPQF